jgi:polar amino acid transport system substrate-binding protein
MVIRVVFHIMTGLALATICLAVPPADAASPAGSQNRPLRVATRATVTSSQTVQRLRSSIQGPDDLPGKAIGSVPGTVAGDYLTQRGLTFVSLKDAAETIRMLTEGELQAVIFDAPTLQYWAAKQGNGVVQVVGPIFRPEKYGIAVANGSALRKPINEALLELYEDGTYEKIYARWFAPGK